MGSLSDVPPVWCRGYVWRGYAHLTLRFQGLLYQYIVERHPAEEVTHLLAPVQHIFRGYRCSTPLFRWLVYTSGLTTVSKGGQSQHPPVPLHSLRQRDYCDGRMLPGRCCGIVLPFSVGGVPSSL